MEGLLGRAGARSALAAKDFWFPVGLLGDADFDAETCVNCRDVTGGSKVGRSGSDVWRMLVHLIGMLCLAGTGDEIRPESTKSWFELARTGGLRGMGGAGFRITSEPGSEGGGKAGALNVSINPKAWFRAFSWVWRERGLCCTLAWRARASFRVTNGFRSEGPPFLSASATVGLGTTTQSGSFLGIKGFDDRFGFGDAPLKGAPMLDRAARPVSSDYSFGKLPKHNTRWNTYHHLTTTYFGHNS